MQSKLCELCPKQQNGERCEATPENLYYGDKGALDCLKEGAGDIAFLEARNIRGECLSIVYKKYTFFHWGIFQINKI